MPNSLDELKELDELILAAIRVSKSLKQTFLTYLLNVSYLHFCGIEEILGTVAAKQDRHNGNLRQMDDRPPVVIGSWDWDVINDRLTADPAVAEIFNLDPVAAAIGLPRSEYAKSYHPDDVEMIDLACGNAIRRGGAYSQVHRVLQKDGSEKWIFVIGRAIIENGRIKHFPGTIIDVTEDETRKRRVMRYRAYDEPVTPGATTKQEGTIHAPTIEFQFCCIPELYVVSWDDELIRPIVPPNGKPIVTLSDARAYILALPKSRLNKPYVAAGIEAVLAAAEERGPILTAQSGIAHIVHGEPKPLNRAKPGVHWRPRKRP